MKALIICSAHALCDIAELERRACTLACARHGIPVILTAQDHADALREATMLEVLGGLPGSPEDRRDLIQSYLDLLNEEIWNASVSVYGSVHAALLEPPGYLRPTGFVSDYPMLTTNLIRSSALVTDATRLGRLNVRSDPLRTTLVAAQLEESAASLRVAPRDVEVLVAHRRDFDAAAAIGMHPRFVEERASVPQRVTSPKRRRPRVSDMPAIAIPNGCAIHA